MIGDVLLDGPARVLRDSLSGLAKRQQLIANNLANMDTPGYRALDIPFEQMLGRERVTQVALPMKVTALDHMNASDSMAEQAVALEARPVFRSDGNGVDVDMEMERLSETAVEYNTVAQLLAARIGLLRSAVTEGRR